MGCANGSPATADDDCVDTLEVAVGTAVDAASMPVLPARTEVVSSLAGEEAIANAEVTAGADGPEDDNDADSMDFEADGVTIAEEATLVAAAALEGPIEVDETAEGAALDEDETAAMDDLGVVPDTAPVTGVQPGLYTPGVAS